MRSFPPIFVLIFVLSACDPQSADGNSAPGATALTPSAIQGDGANSPFAGQSVTVSGVVSGDFQDDDANADSSLGGFYLQNTDTDGNPQTSDGVFVFDRNANGVDVNSGDTVKIIGKVDERFGETQINAVEVVVTGTAQNTAVVLMLPAAGVVDNSDGIAIADLEAFEGMLVRIPQAMYVQDLHGLERFGEIVLSVVPRQHQFTSQNRPDPAGYAAHQLQRATQMLQLDDGRAEQNVSPVRYANGSAAPDFPVRVGDALDELTGVLRYSRGSGRQGLETWRLMPTAQPQFVQHNPRPDVPAVAGNVRIASFNVLNYFATVDTGAPLCGPSGKDGCRGADSAREFARQRQKIAVAINALQADVVGLMEMENNDRAAIDDLLAALNGSVDNWRAVRTGIISTDAIRVALIYRKSTVAPRGAYAVLDRAKDPRFNDDRNRPALAQSFRLLDNDELFTVAVNHLKSKGSSCDQDGDPNRDDGQSNCSRTRTLAAEALGDWLATDPTNSGNDKVLVVGDFNAYMDEDPVAALERLGYVNLLREQVGDSAWSFVYRAESGTLDHAFASKSLASSVSGIAEWHSNADEAPLYDYNLEFKRDPGLFEPSLPWRASDHDPLLIGLQLP